MDTVTIPRKDYDEALSRLRQAMNWPVDIMTTLYYQGALELLSSATPSVGPQTPLKPVARYEVVRETAIKDVPGSGPILTHAKPYGPWKWPDFSTFDEASAFIRAKNLPLGWVVSKTYALAQPEPVAHTAKATAWITEQRIPVLKTPPVLDPSASWPWETAASKAQEQPTNPHDLRDEHSKYPESPYTEASSEPHAKLSDVEIRGAVARGWCHPKNSHKVVDLDLAFAIADEVARFIEAVARQGGQPAPDAITDAMVEAGARAMYELEDDWSCATEKSRVLYLRDSRACLTTALTARSQK